MITCLSMLVPVASVLAGVPNTMYDHSDPVDLPPLMRMSDGRTVSSVRDWEDRRRPEILEFLTHSVYGVRPVERPDGLRFEPIGDDLDMPEIPAVRKRVRISFAGPRGKWGFDAYVFLPVSATPAKRVPAFLLICNRPLERYADPDRKNRSGFFPVEEIVRRGYAAAVFRNEDLARDDYHPTFGPDGTAVVRDPSFTNGFYACWSKERTSESWGAVSAWAWGASRVLDWLETIPVLDAGRVAVVGHSRGGKTALWAAACDSRFALACVNDSGCGGAKLNHVAVSCSETIRQDNVNNPHWFCRAFRQFNGRDAVLPYDQHWVAALVAPRLLYIASASMNPGAGPWGEFLTARHASPAWALYGKAGLVEDHPYRIGDPFQKGAVGYHLREGGHDLTDYDWSRFLDYADRHLARRDSVDAASFGFSPDAEPATNAAALQKALDGGRKTVAVTRPGTYRLDRTVYIDDDTVLDCVKGVVFKKSGEYSQVLLNRGALSRTWNRNITIRGLELRCNEHDLCQSADSPVPNLRGQIAFVRARNIKVQDFVCREYGLVGSCQYCLQISGFEGLLVEDFDIQGGKDGIHLNYGRDFTIRNGRIRSGDDGVALNAGDWPGGVTPLMGSITDGVIENVEDLPGGNWNFARVITGVWTDWHKGMRLQTDDMVRVGKRIYCVWPMPRKRLEDGKPVEWESDTMPTHASGVWKSPEGINFQFLQDDGNVRADITNVVIRNCRLNAERGVFCAWEINDYARLIHPEIPHADYPRIDIRIENCVKSTKTPLVYGCASAHVVLDSVKCAGALANLHRLPENWPENLPSPYYADRTLVVENCDFAPGDRAGADIVVDDPRGQGTARVVLRRNRAGRPVVIDSNVPETKVEGDTPFRRMPARNRD